MKRIVLACAMLEDEINKVYKETGCQLPVIWIERGYHNTPKRLQEKLQSMINELQDMDEILLTFGLCGNGTSNISSPKASLIIPRFDDCIQMLLCDGKRKTRALAEPGAIYITRGWTLDKESIISQYQENIEKYDQETAAEILQMMYEHYRKISVIDTDSYDINKVLDYAHKTAKLLGISQEQVSGSTKIIKQLLTGQWDENFIIQKPGQLVDAAQWELPAGD